jgi:hypothetical protein
MSFGLAERVLLNRGEGIYRLICTFSWFTDVIRLPCSGCY